MKLSVSNIGWKAENDAAVYCLMKKYGYSGLEIAPTRLFSENPYDRPEEGKKWKEKLFQDQGFTVCSMQSIWFGRQEKLFGKESDRNILMEYTKKAIRFAAALGCKNLVFGCPANRNKPEDADLGMAVSFFKELGDYAYEKGTAIGMEANPPVYHTNFINQTQQALDLVQEVGSKGFLLNLDVGTMLYNQESAEILKGQVQYFNHVHISEPGLKPIQERKIHQELKHLLLNEGYEGFISIETGNLEDRNLTEDILKYVRTTFGK